MEKKAIKTLIIVFGSIIAFLLIGLITYLTIKPSVIEKQFVNEFKASGVLVDNDYYLESNYLGSFIESSSKQKIALCEIKVYRVNIAYTYIIMRIEPNDLKGEITYKIYLKSQDYYNSVQILGS
jgi:hypothetical protein